MTLKSQYFGRHSRRSPKPTPLPLSFIICPLCGGCHRNAIDVRASSEFSTTPYNLCGGSARTQLQTLPPCARAGVWRDCPCGTCGVFPCGVVWQDISRCVQSHTSTHPTTEALHSSSAGEPTSSPADRRRQTKRPHQFAAVTFPGSADVVHGILHSAGRRRQPIHRCYRAISAAAVTLSCWPRSTLRPRRCAKQRRWERFILRAVTLSSSAGSRDPDKPGALLVVRRRQLSWLRRAPKAQISPTDHCAAAAVTLPNPARFVSPDRGRLAGGVERVQPRAPPPVSPFPTQDKRRSTFRLERPAWKGGAPNPQ